MNPKQKKKPEEDIQTKFAELKQQFQTAQEGEKRAVADYQNLLRRNQQERASLIKLATKGLVEDLLQPLEHLSLAAQQLDDSGLNMVISQFWQKLRDHGLEEINPLEKPFDLSTMEAVESNGSKHSDKELVVTQVRRKGYTLNGQVIQFAQVVVDSKK